jgi:hypothetical protein
VARIRVDSHGEASSSAGCWIQSAGLPPIRRLRSQGHPRAPFQRATERGDLLVAEATLRVELPRPTLTDPLDTVSGLRG